MNNHANQNTIKIISWNANGLRNKFNELHALVSQTDPDIVIIQETKLNKKLPTKIPHYEHINQPLSQRGGLLTYVKTQLNATHTPTNTLLAETQAITIHNLTIVNYYNPPRLQPDQHELNNLFQLSNKTAIIGDFNATHTNWNNTRNNGGGVKLSSYVDNTNTQLSYPANDHTHHPYNIQHNSSTIDLMLSRNVRINNISALGKLSSDHTPLLIEIGSLQLPIFPPRPARTTDWKQFGLDAKNITLDTNIQTNTDIDEAISSFTEQIMQIFDKNTKETVIKYKLDLPPDLHLKIKHKNKLRKIYQRNKFQPLKNQINQLTNSINTQISELKNDNWNKALSKITPQDKRKLWRIAKALKNKNKSNTMPTLQTPQGPMVTNLDKANAIAATYLDNHNLTQNLSDPQTRNMVQQTLTALHNEQYPTPPEDLLSPQEVKLHIKSLKNKAPGYDNLSPIILKHLPKKPVLQIYYILNQCLKNQYFPLSWKKAIVIPIPKPGKPKNLPSSYRPISLLPTLSKILEKVMLKRLQQFEFENNNIIPEQFGFRSNHSTVLQLARIINTITYNFNIKKNTSVVTLDIEKAFDTIWHDGLIHKLVILNIPRYLIKLIENFLRNRFFQVATSHSLSDPQPIPAGVPQGSVLAPLLFTYFINDIPKHPNTDVALFADDTALIATSWKKDKSISYLQRHIDILQIYYTKWKIQLNSAKTTLTVFSQLRKDKLTTPLQVNNTIIETSPTVKYLGVTLDQTLTFKHHCLEKKAAANRAFQSLYAILNHKNHLSIKLKLQLYTTMIRPIMLYAAPVWSKASESNIDHLQIIQNKCLRLITGSPYATETYILHELTNVPRIKTIITDQTFKFYKFTTPKNPLTQSITSITSSSNAPFRIRHKLIHHLVMKQ